MSGSIYYNAGLYTVEFGGKVIGHYAAERDAYNALSDQKFAKMKADLAASEEPTLRDQFAMAALAALLNNSSQPKHRYSIDQEIAYSCYAIADAMIKSRQA